MREHVNPLIQDRAQDLPPPRIAKRHHTDNLEPTDEYNSPTRLPRLRSTDGQRILTQASRLDTTYYIEAIKTTCFFFIKTKVIQLLIKKKKIK
jgi:hypothetical protein